jgi:hypothetical protein
LIPASTVAALAKAASGLGNGLAPEVALPISRRSSHEEAVAPTGVYAAVGELVPLTLL